jgi:hypothetical protein
VGELMNIDTSEIDRLAADLGSVGALAGPFINSAVQFTSKNIKQDAQKSVSKRKHFKQAAAAIDYEVSVFRGFGASVLKAEIGYDKGEAAGALGNLIEFGAPNSIAGPLTPTSDLANALKANQGDFEKGLSKALADAEKKAGL